MDNLATAVVTIIGAIITVAIVSVLVSRNSQTPAALSAAGGFVSRVISAAVSPGASGGAVGNPDVSAFSMPRLPGLGSSAIGANVSFNFGGYQ